MVKNPPAKAGDARDVGSIPGLGRSPGGGNGNPFQYSCLENSMDRGVWWATVHEATKSQTRLSTRVLYELRTHVTNSGVSGLFFFFHFYLFENPTKISHIYQVNFIGKRT